MINRNDDLALFLGGAVESYAENPAEQVSMAEDGVIDLMDFNMDPDEEEKIRNSLKEKTKYKEVAPTWELNIEKYGKNYKLFSFPICVNLRFC